MLTGSNPLAAGSWLATSALIALLCVCVVFLATQGRVESSPERFMPRDGVGMPGALQQAADAAGANRLLLASISGGEPEQRATASQALAAGLEDDDGVVRVANGSEMPSREALERLLPYRYLLSPGVSEERFSTGALEQALRERRQELASPLGGMTNRRWLAADPTGELQTLISAWRGDRAPARRDGVWASGDGERALLIIETAASATGLDQQARILSAVRAAFRASASATLELALTGPAVFAVNARDTIRSEVRQLSIAATGLLVVILAVAFRSIAAIAVIGIPLAGAILVGATAVTLVFGAVHGIALAFGCTLVGVAVDYPVHLLAHRQPGEPARACMERIWPTLRLGVVTTVLGYSAMAFADVPGLIQLGLFAMTSLTAAALITRYLLPWLIASGASALRKDSHGRWLTVEPPAWGRRALLAAAAICLGVLVWGQERLWQEDLNALSPVPADVRTLDARLREDLGVADLRYLAVIRGADAQQVLERSEALGAAMATLVRAGTLARVGHPAAMLPSRETQLQRRAALPPAAELEGRVSRIAGELGFRDNAFDDFVSAVETARGLAPLTPTTIQETFLAPYLDDRLFEAEGRWWGLVRFLGVNRPWMLHAWFREHAPDGVEFVDAKRRIESTLAEFREAALLRFALGAALILIVLTIGLRSLSRALAVAGPALLAAAGSAALLVAFGERLTVFHLTSMLLVVGLGLDYALFFNRRAPDRLEQRRTRRALLLCGLSTLGVFGLLSVSEFAVLRDIGRTVTLGTLLALLFGWLGSYRRARQHPDYSS